MRLAGKYSREKVHARARARRGDSDPSGQTKKRRQPWWVYPIALCLVAAGIYFIWRPLNDLRRMDQNTEQLSDALDSLIEKTRQAGKQGGAAGDAPGTDISGTDTPGIDAPDTPGDKPGGQGDSAVPKGDTGEPAETPGGDVGDAPHATIRPVNDRSGATPPPEGATTPDPTEPTERGDRSTPDPASADAPTPTPLDTPAPGQDAEPTPDDVDLPKFTLSPQMTPDQAQPTPAPGQTQPTPASGQTQHTPAPGQTQPTPGPLTAPTPAPANIPFLPDDQYVVFVPEVDEIFGGSYGEGYDTPGGYIEALAEEYDAAPEVTTPPGQVKLVLMARLRIDRLAINDPVVKGQTKKDIKYALGYDVNTAMPGEKGNCFIIGHRSYTPGTHFNRLGEIQFGDLITLTDMRGEVFHYMVDEIFLAAPGDVRVRDDFDPEEKRVTLLTCHPIYVGSERLIVRGTMIDDLYDAQGKPLPAPTPRPTPIYALDMVFEAGTPTRPPNK